MLWVKRINEIAQVAFGQLKRATYCILKIFSCDNPRLDVESV